MITKQTVTSYRENVLLAGSVIGLCPVIVKATTLCSAFILGIVSFTILILTSVSVSICRRMIPYSARPVFLLLITTTWVTVIDLLMQVYLFEFRMTLDIYIPLLAVNGFILMSLDESALQQEPQVSLLHASKSGLGILVFIVVLGTVREIFGAGGIFTDTGTFSLFIDTDIFRPLWIMSSKATVFNEPAGAFFVFGIVLAIIQHMVKLMDFKRVE